MAQYHEVLQKCWEQVLNLDSSFPPKIVNWIRHKIQLKGVPTTYIAWPLLVATAHASQHTAVLVGKKGKLAREPTVLYALAVGRTCKCICFLSKISTYFSEILVGVIR